MIRVSDYEFDTASYDEGGDLLTLRVRGSRGVAESTPEGHAWFFADETSDKVIGLVIHGARAMLEQEGGIFVTLPDGQRVRAPQVERVIPPRRSLRTR